MRFIGDIFARLRTLRLASVAVAAFLCTGCNSRVFVERTELDTDLVELGAEGGAAEFHFTSGDWMVSDVIVNGHRPGCTVVKGSSRMHSDQPELSGNGTLIMDKVGAVECSISRKDKNRLVVMLPVNTSDADAYISVWVKNSVFSWDLGVRQPHITYPEVEKIGCALVNDSEVTTLDQGWIFKVDNAGTQSGSARKKVFDKCFRMVDILIEQTTLPSTDWNSILKMTGGQIPIPIPDGTPSDGKLVFSGETALFAPGEQYVECAMPDTEIDLEIKPGKYTYKMLWEYVEYDAEFHLYLKTADGKHTATVEGTLHSRMPDGKYYVIVGKDEDSEAGGADIDISNCGYSGNYGSDLTDESVTSKIRIWP